MADIEELQQAHEDLYASYEQLVAGLQDGDWDLPTGCPGWSVRDILAHVVGVEGLLAGDPEPDHELPGDLPHVRNEFGRYMEVHVDARRAVDVHDLTSELHDVFARRRAAVAALQDAGQEVESVMGSRAPAARVLTVRVLDLWMHDQDLRRALGRPGHRTGPAADISLRRIRKGLAHELPGRLGDAKGVATIEITGDGGRVIVIDLEAGQDLPHPPEDAAVTVRLDLDAFLCLAGGRSDAPTADTLELDGDDELGRRLVGAMSITP